MPVLPINSSRTTAPDNRLHAGSIVEYEHSGKPLLAVILGEAKGSKWSLLNERGRNVELPADRLYLLPGSLAPEKSTSAERAEELTRIAQQAETDAASVNLEELWEVCEEANRDFSVGELTELASEKSDLHAHAALRRALLADTIYFKRKKNQFEPRPLASVEQLKIQAAVEAEKAQARQAVVDQLVERLRDPSAPLTCNLKPLEQLAALGTHAEGAKESKELVEEVARRARLNLSGRTEDRAFEILLGAGHFSPHENLALYRCNWQPNYPSAIHTSIQ
ncbi:MAG: hypothetical protein KDD44_06565, partial [Bdellovibrionales bacterium]|nr:hypothetical protein [Bdellovibrionales bacterium]